MFAILQNDPQCPPGNCTSILAAAGTLWSFSGYGDDPLPDTAGLAGVIIPGEVHCPGHPGTSLPVSRAQKLSS